MDRMTLKNRILLLFSAATLIPFSFTCEAYVYIESGFKLTRSILDLDGVSKHTVVSLISKADYNREKNQCRLVTEADTPCRPISK
ncbi:hypothetical protein [Paenibacillus arenilitoris]|uniref:Uncharacterized protein n=1 Tax=Paenibacillus arenilitoris TaxID=2772299 RepID=A0A927H6Q4_9BACL|nr:hypothetical protein [Paenibacillus arenilitoris]MBD2868804.1 hypothetical protein [Paenibacillus arenilitoris]